MNSGKRNRRNFAVYILFDKTIMKTLLWMAMMICLLTNLCFSQVNFSDETKKYIDYNDPVTVFKNALLIDGTGNPAKPHQTVIIRSGKIDWVGDDSKATLPSDGKVIDLNGKALMPGLVMLHEHMYMSAFSFDPFYLNVRQLPLSFPRLYFAAGATTIRTAGSIEPYSDLRIKKDIDLGLFPGPFMELTAPYIEGKKRHLSADEGKQDASRSRSLCELLGRSGLYVVQGVHGRR
jgi:imidazolonepropionase-like amidohydrolase